MKQLTVILGISIVSMLFLASSCEKDTHGIPVKYYENVTGEGYIFHKYADGTIVPDKYVVMLTREKPREINSEEDADNYFHRDVLTLDDNGKYTCRFFRKSTTKRMGLGMEKNVGLYYSFEGNLYIRGGKRSCKESNKTKSASHTD